MDPLGQFINGLLYHILVLPVSFANSLREFVNVLLYYVVAQSVFFWILLVNSSVSFHITVLFLSPCFRVIYVHKVVF